MTHFIVAQSNRIACRAQLLDMSWRLWFRFYLTYSVPLPGNHLVSMVLTTYPRIRIPTLNYLSGSQCGCKRSFNSESALAQHRADKQKANIGAACRTISVPKSTSSKTATTAKSKEDRWMWNGARTHEAFHVLSTTALHPCTAVVSSKTASELICSYSWQNSEQPCIKIPGITHPL